MAKKKNNFFKSERSHKITFVIAVLAILISVIAIGVVLNGENTIIGQAVVRTSAQDASSLYSIYTQTSESVDCGNVCKAQGHNYCAFGYTNTEYANGEIKGYFYSCDGSFAAQPPHNNGLCVCLN